MNTRKSLFILLLVVGRLCINAQNLDRFPVISDSSHLATAEYQTGNKYQKDAILFMEMVANTHPYYVKAERRAEWFDKKRKLLRQCKGFMSDEDFADALVALLGSLHDKHTDLTTISRMRERKPVPTDSITIVNETPAPANMQHIMRPHTSFYDYTFFPDEGICYLQFNKCVDAKDYPFTTFLNDMFDKIEASGIKTLIVDVQYNNGGSSRLCDQLLEHLCPLNKQQPFTTFIRYSDLMTKFNPQTAKAKTAWENQGHQDELYQAPAPQFPTDYQPPKLFEGEVVFVMGPRTFSSAGMLLTQARDYHIGTIVGTQSTFSPSHYGDVLPYRLPNTSIVGSISSKYFVRPNVEATNDTNLLPDHNIDLSDKDAAWQYIVGKFGKREL